MEYEIVIAPAALRDLEQIGTYIARDNPPASQTFCLKLLDEAESLRTFPERGGFIPERQGARFVMVLTSLFTAFSRSRAPYECCDSGTGHANGFGCDFNTAHIHPFR